MRSAEEWAKQFFTTYRPPDAQWYVDEVLRVGLTDTLRRYARECVEMERDKGIRVIEEYLHRPLFLQIIEVLRVLPVETP